MPFVKLAFSPGNGDFFFWGGPTRPCWPSFERFWGRILGKGSQQGFAVGFARKRTSEKRSQRGFLE